MRRVVSVVFAAIILPFLLAQPAAALSEPCESTTAPAATTAHPRLLFCAGDLPALRKRVESGVWKAAFDRIKRKSDGYLLKVDPEVVRQNPVLVENVWDPVQQSTTYDGQGNGPYLLQNEMPTYLIELAMTYQLMGEDGRKYGRHAVELLLALADADFPFWTAGVDLGIGDLNEGLGLAFDWTYELMTPEERSHFVDAVTREQDTLFVRPLFEYRNEASTYLTSNWSGVLGGGTGLLLLAIKGEPGAPTTYTSPPQPGFSNVPAFPETTYTFDQYLAKAIYKAAGYLSTAFDPNGAHHEGHSYTVYGLKNSVPFAHALRREGRGDILAGTGALNAATWAAFEQLPGQGQNYVPINDSTKIEGGIDFAAMQFGINPDNGVAQWLWKRTVGDYGHDFYNQPHLPEEVSDDICPLDRVDEAPLVSAICPAFAHVHGNVWTILWYQDPSQTPEVNPATVSRLSVHHEDLGLIDARTGFTRGTPGDGFKHGELEMVSTFQARRNGIAHFQYDLGNFTIYGHGAEWAIDPGTSCVGCGNHADAGYPIAHNVVLIDRAGVDLPNRLPSHLSELNVLNPYWKPNTVGMQYVWSRYFNGTTIDRFLNAPNVSVAHADLRYAYNFESPYAGRDHLFSRVPGRPVIVGIADQVKRTESGNHAYEWQMLTDQLNVIQPEGSGFTISAPNGAQLAGRTAADGAVDAAGDPQALIRYQKLDNGQDDTIYAPVVFTKSQRKPTMDHLAVLAMTPPGEDAATTETLRVTGGNAVAVDWKGVREVVVRRLAGQKEVTGPVAMNGTIGKLMVGAGESVLRAGTQLTAGDIDYIRVTGRSATVTVSGDEVSAAGSATNSYRVYAPDTISSVTVNGVQVRSCRDGDYLTFPCRLPTTLELSAPVTAAATDVARFSVTLRAEGSPLAGGAVQLAIGGLTATATTDAAGTATIELPLALDPATYDVFATYAGDSDYGPSSATAQTLVEPDETQLAYTGQTEGRGEQVDVSAVLTEDDDVPLAGQPVVFASGDSSVTAITDDTGRADAVLTIADHGRAATVTVTFAGATRHAGSTVTTTVTWGHVQA